MVRFDADRGISHGGASHDTVVSPARDLALTDEVAGAARPQPLTLTLTCVAPAVALRDTVLSIRHRCSVCACTHGDAGRVGPGACTPRALDPEIGLRRPPSADDERPDPDLVPTVFRRPDVH